MKLRVLLVVIGFAAASSPHAQQVCQPHFTPSNVCHGNTATTSYYPVCTLASGYNPTNFNPNYTSPKCNGGQGSYKALFDAVYGLLDHHRDDVNKKFCNLNNLFVTTD